MIADGETGKAVGMEASWDTFGVIGMGESHPRLPHPFKDAVVLSAGDRYQELVKRVEKGLGKFDAESARHLMDRPVAMKSNLHSVLFETTTTRFWVANASKDGKPAAEQPYHAFKLRELLDSSGGSIARRSCRHRRRPRRGPPVWHVESSSLDRVPEIHDPFPAPARSTDIRGEHFDADAVDCRGSGCGLRLRFANRGRAIQENRPANQGRRGGCQGRVEVP